MLNYLLQVDRIKLKDIEIYHTNDSDNLSYEEDFMSVALGS